MLLFGISLACSQEAVTAQGAEPVETKPAKAEPIRTDSVAEAPAKLSASAQLAEANAAKAWLCVELGEEN